MTSYNCLFKFIGNRINYGSLLTILTEKYSLLAPKNMRSL